MVDALPVDGRSLSLEGFLAVARGPRPVALAPDAKGAIAASRRAVEQAVASGRAVYGVTTGFGKFAEMLGGYGEEVRDPAQIAPALKRARESIQKLRRSAVVNIWVDPREYAPGTKNQTMYK